MRETFSSRNFLLLDRVPHRETVAVSFPISKILGKFPKWDNLHQSLGKTLMFCCHFLEIFYNGFIKVDQIFLKIGDWIGFIRTEKPKTLAKQV